MLTASPCRSVNKFKPLFNALLGLKLIVVSCQPNAATDIEIGAAEICKAAVVFAHFPGGDAGPPWLDTV